MRHIKENQEKLDRYNLGKQIAQGLNGGRNTAPQNSGCAVAYVHLSQPVYDGRGCMRRSISFADSATIRGEENIMEAINRGAVEFGFSFMKITKADDVHKSWQGLHGQKRRASSWEWVKPSSKKEAIEIIEHNRNILGVTKH